ncbi:hypothetical protein P43SY_004996 [Pythium insidiosum]|uniref:PHD-type domain-containing protein n=1 Tax=Pythium insidiosum TaxID=114742 RepID=A0AAD5M7J6_PYTIN|nr:hypothetical protein P43SY_004996 [Pythium insidiosum]
MLAIATAAEDHQRSAAFAAPGPLTAAVAKALVDSVAVHESCFIARGLCHLCPSAPGDDAQPQLVPVINFCPAFDPKHSLCREHLRSMHRVRLEDIFAGKNQPTASKRSLQCSVCALSCPCAQCQRTRDALVARCHRWLFAAGEDEERDELSAASQIERLDPPNRQVSHKRPRELPVPRENSELPTAESMGKQLPAFERAEPKTSTRLQRNPKRAAKEMPTDSRTPASPRSAPSGTGVTAEAAGVPMAAPSPSAESVLKCPDSEKSLVQLLSSLNQEVTPAVRFIAEAKDPRARKAVSNKDSAGSNGANTASQAEGGATPAEPTAATDAALPRPKQKRKREVVAKNDDAQSTASSEQASEKARDRAILKKKDTESEEALSSYRRKAPAPLTVDKRPTPKRSSAPSPSPRGRPRKTPPPEPKASTKKKPSSPHPTTVTQKKRRMEQNPHGGSMEEQKAVRGRQGQHRRSLSRGSKGGDVIDSDDEMRSQAEAEGAMLIEDEEGEDSELDSNLDYCEVCLSAGDLVCCDFCPRSFHLSCLKMTEKDLPEGDWQCAECRKPSYFDAFQVTVAEKTTVVSKCLQIIKCLKSHPFAKPFLFPVEDVPDYTSIVKQPMDLSTIEHKLQQQKYLVNGSGTLQGAGNGSSRILHLGAFAEDVRLIWHNCKLYNDDGSGIVRAADELSAGFERLYQHVLDFVTSSSGKGLKAREEKRPSKAPTLSEPRAPMSTSSRSRNSVTKTGGERPRETPPKPGADGDSVSSTSTETDCDDGRATQPAVAAENHHLASDRSKPTASTGAAIGKPSSDSTVDSSSAKESSVAAVAGSESVPPAGVKAGADTGSASERVSQREKDNASSPTEGVV